MEYKSFKHTINIENNDVETYGIILYVNDIEAVRVYDVSTDYASISEFVYKINASHLDPVELGQALEKYFNEY